MAEFGIFDVLPIHPADLVPGVGSILSGIFKIARKIYAKVQDVQANKRQCLTLSERINRVVGHLNSKEFKKRIDSYGGALKQTLESFSRFLQECFDYVSLFVDMGWIRKFLYSREHKEQFEDLNSQLVLFFGELNVGMNIKQFIDKKRDKHDQTEDSNETLRMRKSLYRRQGEQIDQWGQVILDRIDQVHGNNEQRLKLKSPFPMKDKNAAFPSNHIFVSGTYSLRYSQYGAWHGPFTHKMTFHTNSSTFDGQGENDVGQFTMSGTFSRDSNRIDVIQLYKYGTGNAQLNAGHQCQFQLTWNKEKRLFVGINAIPRGTTMVPLGKIEMSLQVAAA